MSAKKFGQSTGSVLKSTGVENCMATAFQKLVEFVFGFAKSQAKIPFVVIISAHNRAHPTAIYR